VRKIPRKNRAVLGKGSIKGIDFFSYNNVTLSGFVGNNVTLSGFVGNNVTLSGFVGVIILFYPVK
jgi:hypothetical protein